jgi:hypothetical protein
MTRKPTIHIITARFAGTGGITAKTQHYNQGRLLQEISPGRPQSIDPDTLQCLREALRDELQRYLKHYEKLPSAKHTAALVHDFAKKHGVVTGSQTLRRRITRPVLRELGFGRRRK